MGCRVHTAVTTSAASHAQDACERLIAAKISGATITLAQTVAAGTFAGPPAPFSGVDVSALYKNLPAFCRVVAEAKPTADSDIKTRSVAARFRMEWKVAGHWQRRIRRADRLCAAQHIDEQGLCGHCDRYGAYGIAD